MMKIERKIYHWSFSHGNQFRKNVEKIEFTVFMITTPSWRYAFAIVTAEFRFRTFTVFSFTCCFGFITVFVNEREKIKFEHFFHFHGSNFNQNYLPSPQSSAKSQVHCLKEIFWNVICHPLAGREEHLMYVLILTLECIDCSSTWSQFRCYKLDNSPAIHHCYRDNRLFLLFENYFYYWELFIIFFLQFRFILECLPSQNNHFGMHR